MSLITSQAAAAQIKKATAVTFLTGAGVSTPSGIPDYRSLKGVYHGLDQPEYLLSRDCLLDEPAKFYTFIKNLYHPAAKPNVIHRVMSQLEEEKVVHVVSQNIDGLHAKAGSKKLVNFHGSLYDCKCQKCQQKVSVSDYLTSDRHKNCGGQIRPQIVLYGEGFTDEVLNQAVAAVTAAELIVIVGTSFQVHPFCDLIRYKKSQAKILVLNQTPITVPFAYDSYEGNSTDVFELLSREE